MTSVIEVIRFIIDMIKREGQEKAIEAYDILRETLTGRFSQPTMLYSSGGSAAIVAGLLLARLGKPPPY